MERSLTRRGQERRDQLVAEAIRLFAEQGYHRTSVSEIVNACGVGKGVFYWYFESKEALLLAILDESLEALRREQAAAFEGVADPVERIAVGIGASLDFLSANDDVGKVFEFAATDATFASAMERGIEIVVEDITKHLKEAIVDSLIPDRDPYFLGYGIATITMHFFRSFLGSQASQEIGRDDVAAAAVEFCMHGIGLGETGAPRRA